MSKNPPAAASKQLKLGRIASFQICREPSYLWVCAGPQDSDSALESQPSSSSRCREKLLLPSKIWAWRNDSSNWLFERKKNTSSEMLFFRSNKKPIGTIMNYQNPILAFNSALSNTICWEENSMAERICGYVLSYTTYQVTWRWKLETLVTSLHFQVTW